MTHVIADLAIRLEAAESALDAALEHAADLASALPNAIAAPSSITDQVAGSIEALIAARARLLETQMNLSAIMEIPGQQALTGGSFDEPLICRRHLG